jgi:hypothetical protein
MLYQALGCKKTPITQKIVDYFWALYNAEKEGCLELLPLEQQALCRIHLLLGKNRA